jgi:uncharacterized protein YjbJ (UPF0337 family)
MNRDRVEGSVKQATGAVKEAVGKATGNRRLQSKGIAEKPAAGFRTPLAALKTA